MAAPHQPETGRSSKAGVKPGSTPNTDSTRKSDRPVKEHDAFGGAERTHNPNVKSENAKP
jgi:hypothetical protein